LPALLGASLDLYAERLIRVAVWAAETALDRAKERGMRVAPENGVAAAKVHEELALMWGLGVHTLMMDSPMFARNFRERSDEVMNETRHPPTTRWVAMVDSDPF
jgi:hypothetical protein